MKSKLKMFLMALIILPCAFVFSACGGDQLSQQANLNTNGSYTATNLTEARNATSENVNNENIYNGYRASMNISMVFSTYEIKYNTNLIYKQTKQNNEIEKLEIAMRTTATLNNETVKTDIFSINTKNDINTYVDIQSPYINGKFAYKQSIDEITTIGFDASMFEELIENHMPNINVNLWTNSNFFEISKSDNSTKIKIKVPAGNYKGHNYAEANVYYVYENNIFQGFKIENLTINSITYYMQNNITVCPFTDEIQYPDFNQFK